MLTMRDIKVRYKQTVLGFAWAIIQPVMMMVVFSVFFGRLAQMPSDGYSLSDLRLCRPAALDLLRQRHQHVRQFAGRLGAPREQGLFPAPHHPARFGRRRPGRFRDLGLRPSCCSWSGTASAGA